VGGPPDGCLVLTDGPAAGETDPRTSEAQGPSASTDFTWKDTRTWWT